MYALYNSTRADIFVQLDMLCVVDICNAADLEYLHDTSVTLIVMFRHVHFVQPLPDTPRSLLVAKTTVITGIS